MFAAPESINTSVWLRISVMITALISGFRSDEWAPV